MAAERPVLLEIKNNKNIRLEIKYAGRDNFLKYKFYKEPKAFLVKPAYDALLQAADELAADGLGFIIFDAYRPLSVSKKMWKIADSKQKKLLANPFKSVSVHNRGAALDLTLYDLKTTEALPMKSEYDEVSARSKRSWKSYSDQRMHNTERLKIIMEKFGFKAIENEWWHFEWHDYHKYPEQDWTF